MSLPRTIVGISAILLFLYVYAWDNPQATRAAYMASVEKIEECSKRAKSICPVDEDLCPLTKITTPAKILTNPTKQEEKGAEKVKAREENEKDGKETEKVTGGAAEKAAVAGVGESGKSCQKCCEIAEECSGQRAEVRLLQRRKRPLVGIASWLFDSFRPAHLAKKSCVAKAASASRTNKTINASITISYNIWIGVWAVISLAIAYWAFKPIMFNQALGGTTTTTTTAGAGSPSAGVPAAAYDEVVKEGQQQISPSSSPRRNVRKED